MEAPRTKGEKESFPCKKTTITEDRRGKRGKWSCFQGFNVIAFNRNAGEKMYTSSTSLNSSDQRFATTLKKDDFTHFSLPPSSTSIQFKGCRSSFMRLTSSTWNAFSQILEEWKISKKFRIPENMMENLSASFILFEVILLSFFTSDYNFGGMRQRGRHRVDMNSFIRY